MRRGVGRWLLVALASLALITVLGRPLAAVAGRDPAWRQADDLPVLAYHEIEDPARAVMPDDAMRPAAFKAQLTWLADHGHHFVSLDQVLRARNGRERLPAHPVLLTFDDGYTSVYTTAFPLLQRLRAPAVLAVVGRWLEPEHGPVRFGDAWLPRERLLSWEQLREMQRILLAEDDARLTQPLSDFLERAPCWGQICPRGHP